MTKRRIILTIIVTVLLVIVATASYKLGIRNESERQWESLNEKANEYDYWPSPTPEATPIPEFTEYKTRYFGIKDPFYNLTNDEAYPLELTNLKESQLQPITCTHTYNGEGEYSYSDETNPHGIPLTNSTLLTYIETLNKKYDDKDYDKTVNQIFACSTKEGKTIIVYSLGPCGGGCFGDSYIGIVNKVGEIKEITGIPGYGAYFNCPKPLQLSSSNNFYFECGGGDGPSGTAYIYKLSLNNLSLSKVISCETGINDKDMHYSVCK